MKKRKNTDKIIGNVYGTREYNKLKFILGNRNIDRTKVANLINSFKEKQLINPIIINNKFEIIDGQHRFEAQKSLNLQIPYIIGSNYGYDEVILLNTNQTNWKNADFLAHFISMGNTHYIKLKEFMDEYGLTLQQTIGIIDEGLHHKAQIDAFKSGQFRLNETELKKGSVIAKKYNMIRDLWSFSSFRSFVNSFKRLLMLPDLDWDRFYNSCQKYSYIMEKRSTSSDFSRLFQKMYNFNRKNRVRLIEDDL